MKRIRVPEGMMQAAKEAMRRCPVVIDVDQGCDGGIITILKAALLWASEHPQVPTDEQAAEIWEKNVTPYRSFEQLVKQIIDAWQRRCFVQEEPEIPAELKDLLYTSDFSPAHYVISEISRGELDKRVLEAYRRGLRKGEHHAG